jgi:putative flippase GtrA
MLGSSLERKLQRLGRFTVVGGLNTIIGTLAIFGLQALTGNPRISNFIGYVIGGIVGYFLHARYTFTASVSRRSFGIFGCVAVISFLVNQLVLSYALKILAPFIAQALAILSYAIVSFALQSRLAFPDGNRKASYHAKLNQPR